MVDKETIVSLAKWKDGMNLNWPCFDTDFDAPCMEALGDDEDEIIKFISEADELVLRHISSITELLFAKFPTDKMEAALDKYFA